MVDTGQHFPSAEDLEARKLLDEIAAGSKYDRKTDQGTGLFRPLSREELMELGRDPE